MTLYAILDGLKVPGGYAGKFFLVAFVGVHVPLIAGFAWAMRGDAVDWPMFLILLLATLGGTAMTLLGLHALLAPIGVATAGLEAYARDATLPRLPTTHRDLAGRLMAQTQETLAELDNALTAARAGQRAALDRLQGRERAIAEATGGSRASAANLVGLAELLQLRPRGPAIRPHHVETVGWTAPRGHHLPGLVESVQHVTRIVGGGGPAPEREEVVLAAVAERAAQLLHREEEAGGVRIRVEVPIDVFVFADPRSLLQILLNLVGNAVRYAGPGATATVDVEPGDHEDTVIVRDDGPGMTGEQARATSDGIGGGVRAEAEGEESGLGLPLAKALVEAQGGRLTIDAGRDRGTTVRFTLPRALARPA